MAMPHIEMRTATPLKTLWLERASACFAHWDFSDAISKEISTQFLEECGQNSRDVLVLGCLPEKGK